MPRVLQSHHPLRGLAYTPYDKMTDSAVTPSSQRAARKRENRGAPLSATPAPVLGALSLDVRVGEHEVPDDGRWLLI